jgi:hypothetical protein
VLLVRPWWLRVDRDRAEDAAIPVLLAPEPPTSRPTGTVHALRESAVQS